MGDAYLVKKRKEKKEKEKANKENPTENKPKQGWGGWLASWVTASATTDGSNVDVDNITVDIIKELRETLGDNSTYQAIGDIPKDYIKTRINFQILQVGLFQR